MRRVVALSFTWIWTGAVMFLYRGDFYDVGAVCICDFYGAAQGFHEIDGFFDVVGDFREIDFSPDGARAARMIFL